MKNVLRIIYHQYRKKEKNFGFISVLKPIVIFESDDWGCQRIHSQKERDFLSSYAGFFPHDPFENGDALETESDINNLSLLLASFSDSRGFHPIFTLNYVMNNLIFSNGEKKDDFSFRFERLDDTYSRMGITFPWNLNSMTNKPRVFDFSLHAFAHLNQTRFMEDILKKKNGANDFYDHCVVASTDPKARFCYMDEMGGGMKNENIDLEILGKAVKQFSEIFGHPSMSFTPSCGVILKSSLKSVCDIGNFRCIKISDGFFRSPSRRGYSKHAFFTGQKISGSTARFLCRNCDFEPIFYGKDSVSLCLQDIEQAFQNKKPAIISTHRMNYVRGFDGDNYTERIEMLSNLLSILLSKYPDVMFMSTDDFIERFFHEKH